MEGTFLFSKFLTKAPICVCGLQLDILLRLTSPTILTDLNIDSIDSVRLFPPAVIGDLDGPNVTAGHCENFGESAAYTCHAVELQPFLQTFELHLEVMDRRDTRAGCLRTFEMTVGDFEPMPSEEVPAAMQDFIRWFNQHLLAESMTAGEFSARAHHTLVYIHPFYNGNGKTARLLMNFVLMRRGFQPIILPEEKHDEYYSAWWRHRRRRRT
ncbi:hypothetical protein niasHT_008565 [Heterodera trifolii]|uniref:Fido domain-containing protein n=1 Tax=Heterodera trifolii TaxID=157864 RepID=A0ABD2MAI2_9BILA